MICTFMEAGDMNPKSKFIHLNQLHIFYQAIRSTYFENHPTKLLVLHSLLFLSISCGKVPDALNNTDDVELPCLNSDLTNQQIDGFSNLIVGRSCHRSLASVSISKIVSDSNGTMYLLTTGGLTIVKNQNDQLVYNNKTIAQGISATTVRDIFIDKNDNIYLATYAGLAISTNQGESFTTKTTGLPLWYGIPITMAVVVDSEGRIFVGTTSGVCVSSDGGDSFITKTTAHGLGNNYISGLAIDSLDNIYVTSSGGLSISSDHGASFVNRTTANGLYSNSVTGIYVDTNSKIHISMYSYGVGQAVGISTDGGTSFVSTVIPGANGKHTLRAIVTDSNGNIYAGTDQGVAVSTNGGNSYTIMGAEHGLESDAMISSIHIDANNKIYASDLVRGLYMSNDFGNTFIADTLFQETGGGSYGEPFVTSDNIYLPSNSGLFILKKDTRELMRLTKSDGLPSNQVSGVVKSEDGTLYILTDVGISITHDQGKTFTNKGASDGAPIGAYSIAIDSQNNLFATGYNIGGLMISTDGGNSWTKKTTSNGLPTNNTTYVYVDHNDVVYISTSSGLAKTTDQGTTFFNRNTGNGLGHAFVYKVSVEPITGTILVGTNNGLSISTDGGITFTTKRQAAGLGGRFVQKAVMKSDGTVYAMTDGGLSVSNDSGSSFSVTSIKSYAGSVVLFEDSELYVVDGGYAYFKAL